VVWEGHFRSDCHEPAVRRCAAQTGTKQELLKCAKSTDIKPDTYRHRHNSYKKQKWTFHKSPETEPQVLKKTFRSTQCPDLATFFPPSCKTAEAPSSRRSSMWLVCRPQLFFTHG